MNNINKIINLVKKTGDKFVLMDEDGASFVIMPLSDYEKIVGGRDDYSRMSERELLDSVERDIALWRAEHEGDENYPWETETEPWEMQKEPLSFGDKEPLSWDEEEPADSAGEEENKSDKFSIPEERIEHQEGNEPIKYEDIPPPPDLNIDDLMPDKNDKVIDMSFDEEENEESDFGEKSFNEDEDLQEGKDEDEDEENNFMEEPVF